MEAVAKIAGDEVTKFVTGGGVSAGALADREKVEKTLSRAGSPAQLKGVIENYQHLMAGQLEPLKRQYEANLKDVKGALPFGGFLDPRAAEILGVNRPQNQAVVPGNYSNLWEGE